MAQIMQPPRQPHSQQRLISKIDEIAYETPDRPWISVPVDDSDLTKGFKDITYGQLAAGVNFSALWLQNNLGLPDDGFPAFAYMGPSDYRYALFVVAAAKLEYQIILPSTMITAIGQHRILELKSCSVYLHGEGTEHVMDELEKLNPALRRIAAPSLEAIMAGGSAQQITTQRLYQDGIENPWLVFHTSGTTGSPKVITFSQASFFTAHIAMEINGLKDTLCSLWAHSRIYVSIPPMHFSSMYIILDATSFANSVAVLGPTGRAPTPAVVKDILAYANIGGATLAPGLIDALCQDPQSLQLLRNLDYVLYIGAPLNKKSGELLSPHMKISPAIGNTEAGPYWTSTPNTAEDWDYVTFQPHIGAVLEHRVDDRYELVFVRDPECLLQVVFKLHPHLDRFETKDLWVEHPTKKGQWKIVGRLDDYVKLSHAHGIMVTPLEAVLAEHPLVKNVLIGGQGRPKPIILIEVVDAEMADDMGEGYRAKLIERLKPSIAKVNALCHEEVTLEPELVVFATKQKPWPRTVKNTIARVSVLKLYEPEIDEAYKRAGMGSSSRIEP